MAARNNYERFEEAKCDLSLPDIVNAYNYIQALMWFVPKNGSMREEYEHVIEPLEKFVQTCKTDAKCPKCGQPLYYSDLMDYEYVCVQCDENFYSIECEEEE